MPSVPQTPDVPPEPGVRLTPHGAQFCVYASHATSVQVCLFDREPGGGEVERRVNLTHRAHGAFFDTLPGVGLGQRYALRVDGEWNPEESLLHNPAKLLLDPYARAIEGEVTLDPVLYGHHVLPDLRGDRSIRDDRDSAERMPRCVVVDDGFDWGDEEPLRRSLTESVVYEVHVRNATMRHPGIPEHLRGTYAGLAHPVFVEHLLGLGVTAAQLLPVQSFTHEPELGVRGMTNHWGYNTLGFFAPHAAYAAADDPQGALDEFKTMVRDLHRAGIEVLLDVVYNHTAEQHREGMTLSWRGIDQRAYYRLDGRGADIDVTGCGNTLDLTHPAVTRLVLDSLRYWVQQCHVDGFRFDLAVALARGKDDGYERDHAFHVALRTDPVLSRVKLIAEPWDLGINGWRTGQFPPPFSEWNDRYRDTVRTFWLRDLAVATSGANGHGVRELATRIAGSQDMFGDGDRGPIASVNFVTAHDGFTLADLTTYDVKHNEANGEGNADGSNDNRSWNHGVEGPSAGEVVHTARRRSMRNLLGTLLMSSGVPMLAGGDEFGRSQGGNNNPYSQNNETSWNDWVLAPWQQDLLETTKHLTALRRSLAVLHRRSFFSGEPTGDEGRADLAWFGVDGQPMGARFDRADTVVLTALLDGTHAGLQSVLLTFNGAVRPTDVTLPEAPGFTAYELCWNSSDERPGAGTERLPAGATVTMGDASMRVWRAH